MYLNLDTRSSVVGPVLGPLLGPVSAINSESVPLLRGIVVSSSRTEALESSRTTVLESRL